MRDAPDMYVPGSDEPDLSDEIEHLSMKYALDKAISDATGDYTFNSQDGRNNRQRMRGSRSHPDSENPERDAYVLQQIRQGNYSQDEAIISGKNALNETSINLDTNAPEDKKLLGENKSGDKK